MRIYFATSNIGKFTEAKEILGDMIVQKKIDSDEIQSLDVKQVAMHKASQAYKKLKKPLIVEDTGLHISALNDFPGALIKPMLTKVGLDGICKIVSAYKDRSAYVETAIAFHDGKKIVMFSSIAKGKIVQEPRGRSRFAHGFDFIFEPEGSRKVFAEMDVHEKNSFTARAKSVRKFKKYIKSLKGFSTS